MQVYTDEKLDRIVEKEMSAGGVTISMGGFDKGWWMKSKDGEVDELVTDEELVALVEELVARKLA